MSDVKHFAISLLQPWASLMVMGHKVLETRSWKPTAEKVEYIKQNTGGTGRLLIHASMGKKGYARELCLNNLFFKKFIKDFDALPFGKILGSVDLTGTFLRSDDFMRNRPSWMVPEKGWNSYKIVQEVAYGDYSPGRWAWLTTNPVEFKNPFDAKGSLNIWDLSDNYYAHFYKG